MRLAWAGAPRPFACLPACHVLWLVSRQWGTSRSHMPGRLHPGLCFPACGFSHSCDSGGALLFSPIFLGHPVRRAGLSQPQGEGGSSEGQGLWSQQTLTVVTSDPQIPSSPQHTHTHTEEGVDRQPSRTGVALDSQLPCPFLTPFWRESQAG